MVKGRKRQHEVGLAMKEEIVKKPAEDGMTIECIGACLLKARILIESNFVTFVLSLAPTEKAPEGQNAKYMAALNCTVAPVLTREYVFALTDANASTEKRCEGGGEADSKQSVGRKWPRQARRKRQTTAGFRRRQQPRSLMNIFVCTPKNGVSYMFQSANHSKGQARLDYILTKQADRRLIRCVNVRRPPLDVLESDHNLVYAKVRMPRRSAPNRRKGDNTRETPKLVDLR